MCVCFVPQLSNEYDPENVRQSPGLVQNRAYALHTNTAQYYRNVSKIYEFSCMIFDPARKRGGAQCFLLGKVYFSVCASLAATWPLISFSSTDFFIMHLVRKALSGHKCGQD